MQLEILPWDPSYGADRLVTMGPSNPALPHRQIPGIFTSRYMFEHSEAHVPSSTEAAILRTAPISESIIRTMGRNLILQYRAIFTDSPSETVFDAPDDRLGISRFLAVISLGLERHKFGEGQKKGKPLL